MKQCSLFFFLSINFFHAENVRLLLLISFLCGGSESFCQRSALRLMTYDMGKKVNSQRESLVYSCGEVQGEGTDFWRGKTMASAFTNIIQLVQVLCKFSPFSIDGSHYPRWEIECRKHEDKVISQVIAKHAAAVLKMS